MTLDFKEKGELIFLLGESHNDLGCSEYLVAMHGVRYSPAPHFDLDFEVKLHEAARMLIDRRLVACAHDVSDGGLFTALVEMHDVQKAVQAVVQDRFERMQGIVCKEMGRERQEVCRAGNDVGSWSCEGFLR